MVLTLDRAKFYEGDFSEISRRNLQTNVLEYQLRSLFDRPGYRAGDIGVSFDIPDLETSEQIPDRNSEQIPGFRLFVYGPVYEELDPEVGEYSPFIREWKNFYANYLSGPYRKKFINALSQTRFVTFNPISIYYQLMMEEQKISSGKENGTEGGMRMRRTKLGFRPVRKPIPIPGKRVTKREEIEKRVPIMDEIKYMRTQREYDGHFSTERPDEEAMRPGLTSWAEGYVDDEIEETSRIIDPELDFPNGAIFNMFPEYPFYAFPVKNVFKKIEDINRMIESGLSVVFMVEKDYGMDLRKVKGVYEDFFRSWGIQIIDYVNMERLKMSGLKYMIPTDTVLPAFFVIKRPMEKLHSSAWSGMNTVRRRGLPGIPWAASELSGSTILDNQPDDGFLNYFVREGIEGRLRGREFMEIDFPLCTLHTRSEIYSTIVLPLENVLKRPLEWRQKGGNVGVKVRNMGEWMLVRGMLRKYA